MEKVGNQPRDWVKCSGIRCHFPHANSVTGTCFCFVMTRQPKYHQACISSQVWILSLSVPLVFRDAGSGEKRSAISKCIRNPLSPLLEALQNHSGSELFPSWWLHHSYRDRHNWLFLRRNTGICGPKVKHAGAWLVELHFIREYQGRAS